MVNNGIVLGLVCLLLFAFSACAAAPAADAVATITPSAQLTAKTPLAVATAAPEPAVPPAVETEAAPESSGGSADGLAALAAAWSSGDVARIRTFYAADAAYVSTTDAAALQRGEKPPVLVAEGAFAGRVAEHAGQRLRVMGRPIFVYDKLAGFLFRWEDDTEGYNGVALLRYEGDQIVLHTYAVSSEQTPNPAAESDVLQSANVAPLMAVWSSGDAEAVKAAYTARDGIFNVFNDEDILLSLRGHVQSPAELAGDYLAGEVKTQAKPWGMRANSDAVRLGEFVLYGWGWAALEEPLGQGVRFMRYDGERIAEDIRYAVRPWEVQGQTFLSGYGTD